MTVPRDLGMAAEPSTDPRSDRDLMTAYQGGDQQAFHELWRRHRQRLWNLALRSLRDREEAADALQDTMLKAVRSVTSYRGDAEPSTWLHRIAVNVCLDRVNNRQRHATVSLDAEDGDRESPSAQVADRSDAFAEVDAQRNVGDLLAILPDEQRFAIVLVDVEGHSVAEAADALGVAVGTIKSRCARGRARLLATLRTDLGGAA